MKACKSNASYDISMNKYGSPSLALKVGHSVNKCCSIVLGNAIENQNKELQQKADEFIKLLQMNWTDDVSSSALKTLTEAKRNKNGLLPSTEDIQALTRYIKTQSEVEHEKLLTAKAEDDISRP